MEYHGIEMIGPFYLEKLSNKPQWTQSDKGRLIYVHNDNTSYIGGENGWIDLTPSSVSHAASANNADTTDGYHANVDPGSYEIVVTNGQGQIPASVIDQSGYIEANFAENSDTVDGFDVSIQNDPNTIPVRDGDGLLSLSTLPQSVQDMTTTYQNASGGYPTLSQVVRTDTSTAPDSDEAYDIGDSGSKYNKIFAKEFNGTATAATYSDLAERYTFPETPNIGEVVLVSFDENYHCQVSNEQCSNRVLGVISENPAFKMNDNQQNGIYVARTGIVPCKVQGPCKKSDVLVSDKYAKAIPMKNIENPNYFATKLGHALENIENDEVKIINIVL